MYYFFNLRNFSSKFCGQSAQHKTSFPGFSPTRPWERGCTMNSTQVSSMSSIYILIHW